MLQKLILSRLESLPEGAREAARAAAVAGSEFRYGEVQALLQDSVDPVTLSAHLRLLVDAQLVSPVEAGVDARYAFQQELVRDVLYNSHAFRAAPRAARSPGRVSQPAARPPQGAARQDCRLFRLAGRSAPGCRRKSVLPSSLELAGQDAPGRPAEP